MPFSHRIVCDRTILKPRFLNSFLICLGPVITAGGIGYSNFGLHFFTVSHWLNYEGSRFHPVFAIAVVVIGLSLIAFSLYDLIRSFPCYVGLQNTDLVVMRRKRYPIVDLDIEGMKIGGLWNNIVFIPLKGTSQQISIPLIKSDLHGAHAIEALKVALRN